MKNKRFSPLFREVREERGIPTRNERAAHPPSMQSSGRDIPMIRPILASLLMACATVGASPAEKSGLEFQIGHIYFYGYAGMNLRMVEAHLPVRSGEIVNVNSFDSERKLIRKSVLDATGRPPTDIAAVCCDRNRHLLIYIGLGGASSRKLRQRKAPVGNDHLDKEGLQLYDRDTAALAKAVENGNAGEDDSHGYALATDPASRKIQLEMRAYAVDRAPELERVLRNSGNPHQREVSAFLLGYAERSGAQIGALMAASTDPNEGVRNNAVRALAVLLSAPGIEIPRNLNIKPLAALLWSGQWTDRNKASFALAAISKDRNPAILQQLRETAMPPLLEGARWDSDHANAFLMILGRIARIPPSELQKEMIAGDATSIIAAAEKM